MSPVDQHSDQPPPGAPGCSPRQAAVEIALCIVEEGFTAYLAGGCVRDELLGIQPTDFDVATSAKPAEIAKIFRGARGVGEAFGVMLVRWKGRVLEVATFRADGPYHDGRRPSDIRFATAEEDAKRRDFTINGLFRDPKTNEVIDFVGGRQDLNARVLRAIGDPAARLNEDRLRTLRAVRFAARFALTVDPETEQAICDAAADLTPVSRERIGGEFRRMFSHPSRTRAVEFLERWGLDTPSLGEVNSMGPAPRTAGLPPDAKFATVLAAWRLDRDSRGVVGSTHRWRDRLNLSGQEWSDLGDTLRAIDALRGSWDGLSKAQRKRLVAGRAFAASLDVLRGEDAPRAGEISAAAQGLAQEPGGVAPVPFVNGADLIALGFRPGPKFKSILDQVYDAQLEGQLQSKEGALRLVQSEFHR